ncbi:MAG TPA: glycosyltransferase family 39 protein, partial [bacterium]|nr:glycosyltransferase family 39 protein [bacterium]
LSYDGLTLLDRMWVFSAAIAVPLFFHGMTRPKGSLSEDIFSGKALIAPNQWIWALAALAGLFVRFYRLEGLSLWPNKDEGTYGFAAMELAHRWDLPFFYSFGDQPPLFFALQGLYFKFLEPSLFSLWLFPALLAAATLFIVGYMARAYFDGAFSFLLFVLTALGFWPVYLGRFCMPGVLILFCECLTLGLLALYLKARDPSTRLRRIALLGAAVGGGFYVSFSHWAAVAATVVLAVLGSSFMKSKRLWKEPAFFFMGAFIVFLPFACESILHPFTRLILEMRAGGADFSWLRQIYLCGSYVAALFWGGGTEGFCYGPLWGGFLNPLSDSFFFLGVLSLWDRRRQPEAQWIGVSFLLLLVPGLASHDLELMRIMMVIPLLLLVTAMGIVRLAGEVSAKWRMTLILALLGFSACLDTYHLAGPYADIWQKPGDYFRSLKSEESYNAYRILSEKSKKDGPGWLFLDFLCFPLDQTLTVASYPFNATLNPALQSSQPTWAAVLTNVNYRPFLAQRFPKAEWFQVGSSLSPWDGEVMVGVIPLDAQNQADIRHWVEVQPLFHEVTRQLARQQADQKREEFLGPFLKEAGQVQGDPFLASSFWEIAYFNHSADKRFQDSFNDLTRILQEGYPAAHIFNELGSLLWFRKDYPEARKAFQRAVLTGGNHTLAVDNLGQLEAGLKN